MKHAPAIVTTTLHAVCKNTMARHVYIPERKKHICFASWRLAQLAKVNTTTKEVGSQNPCNDGCSYQLLHPVQGPSHT